MQFMLSDAVQDIIPTTNWVYPATTTQAGLPQGFETLHMPEKTLLLKGTEVEAEREAWIEQWIEILAQ
jgi:thiamine transport system substrate-binding protein